MVSFLVIPLCVSEWVDWAGGDNEYIRSRKSPSSPFSQPAITVSKAKHGTYMSVNFILTFDLDPVLKSIISLFQQQLLHLLRTQYIETFQAQHI